MGIINNKSGDLEREAARLFSNLHSSLMAEAEALCGDRAAAEDLVMQTIERLCSADCRYDEEKGGIFPYARKVLKNEYLKSIRGKMRKAVVYIDPDELAIISDERAENLQGVEAASEENSETVRAAIASLSPEMREIIMLRHFDECTIPKIARILGLSENSVRCRLHYARKVLAKRLSRLRKPKALSVLAAAFLAVISFAAVKTGVLSFAAGGDAPTPAAEEERAAGQPAALDDEPAIPGDESIVQDDVPLVVDTGISPSNAGLSVSDPELPATIEQQEQPMNTNTCKTILAAASLAASLATSPVLATTPSLPAGYTPVAYIQGNGVDARIKTDYYPQPNRDKIEAVVEFPSVASTVQMVVWCARKNGVDSTWSVFVPYNSGFKFRFDYGNSSTGTVVGFPIADNTKYTLTADANNFTCSGGSQPDDGYQYTKVGDFTTGGPLVLFAAYTDGVDNSVRYFGSHRLYSFKVWRDGALIHDFVPCVDDKGVAKMVDICDNPATLTHEGTFIAGLDGSSMMTVTCNPADCGSPEPAIAVGGLSAGDTVAVSCGATHWTNAVKGVVYACTGWKLYDSDGNAVSNGTDTAFTYVHPTPVALRKLEWQWAVSGVAGSLAAGANGSVSPSGTVWFPVGATASVTATPDVGYVFSRWTGNLPDGFDAYSASVTFTPSAPFDMAAEFVAASEPRIFRVDKLVADGQDGGGTSWADTISLTNAFAMAAARDEIWIKAGTYALGAIPTLASTNAIAVRGGFTGGAVDAARAAGAVSILHGNEENTADPVMSFTADLGRVVLERVEFVKVAQHALRKSGAADIRLDGCRFLHCNASNADTGKVALDFTGTSYARAVVTNCVFEANRLRNHGLDNQQGYTTWFSTFASVEISSCLFATNGLRFSESTITLGRNSMQGAAVYSTAAPLKVFNTDFRGNVYNTYNSDNCGGVVFLAGNATRHSFRNCLFAGNRGANYEFPPTAGIGCGAIYVSLADAAQSVEVENCTFAYNIACPRTGRYVAAGITVAVGSLRCRNSIFHGNVIYSTGTASADIGLKDATASADIDWCMFDSLESPNLQAGNGTLTLGANNLVGDPLLFTSTDEFRTNGFSRVYETLPATYYDATQILYLKENFYNAIGTLNFHLVGPQYYDERTGNQVKTGAKIVSPAVNTGDPASPYANEPVPNGKRVNLGRYGNTPWATSASLAPSGFAFYLL